LEYNSDHLLSLSSGNYDDLLEKMKSFVTPESERRGIVFLLAASSVGQTPGSPTS
jgi:hypothetical protein